MDSENEHSESEQQDILIDVIPLQDKYEKVMNLSNDARMQIENITKNVIKKPILNPHIDPRNEARIFNLQVKTQNIEFVNFMTKRKNQSKKKQAFKIMRQMLEQKGHKNISTLNDKEYRSVMVVRFVNKVENQPNVMEIEDDISKERERIIIRQGIVYVGLICAIEAVYENQMYRMQRMIDLSVNPRPKPPALQPIINHPASAFRILMVKGPFWKNDSKESIGTQMIITEVQRLRYKQNIRIDFVVIMGPVLSQYNEYVANCTLERTIEEQLDDVIETLKKRLQKMLPDVNLLVIPSTDDALSIYPIPQPPFDYRPKTNVRLASNPCTVKLESSRTQAKINFINYDLINYIDESKCGKSLKQPLLENIQTYLKQPFLITNTLEDAAFDETNFGGLFNRGEFGNVIVMSSQRHPVFAHKVKGNKIFLNIGSLGVDNHLQDRHFMTLMSLYDGQGEVSERIRIDSIVM